MHRRAVAVAAVAVALPAGYAGIAAAQGGGDRAQGGDRVTIRMSEFRFRMPSNLDAGRTTIVFRNTGDFPHNFTVVSALGGARAFRSRTVQGGNRARRTLRLRPGSYVAVCTVFNGFHQARGMVKRFTVGEFDQESGEWGP
jgi:plastocyanin